MTKNRRLLSSAAFATSVVVASLACPSAAFAQEQVTAPSTGTVDDPMLTPVAPSKRVVASWDEVSQLIRSRSVDLRIAALEVDKASAQSRVALASLLPTLSGSLSFTHQFIQNSGSQTAYDLSSLITPDGHVDLTRTVNQITSTYSTPSSDYFSGSLNLAWFPLSFASWRQLGTSKSNVVAAEQGFYDTKRTILLNVASALVAVYTAERVAELNRVALRSSLDRAQLTKRKQQLGAATGLDVVRADQDVATTRATLIQGDESLRQTRESFGLALGLNEELGIRADIKLDALLKDGSLGKCTTVSIEERPDVKAARARAEALRRVTGDVRAEFLPQLGIQSNFAGTTLNTGTAPTVTWNLVGVLSMSIWDGGARYGRIHSAEANAEQADQRLLSAQRTAQIQIVQATRGVDVAERARVVAAEGQRLAADADRLVRTAFAAGQGTSLELVTAAAALRQSEVNLVLREFDLVRAKILALLATANCEW